MKKILVTSCLVLIQCNGDEEDKKTTADTDKTSSVADCSAAVTAFADIQTAIDSSCISCHVADRTGTDLYFVRGDKEGNRKVLAGHDDGFWKVAGNLYKKIGPSHANHGLDSAKTEPGHDGEDKSSVLAQDKVTKWTTAEASCRQ